MKKLSCLSAALFIAVVLVMANPLVNGNGPDQKRKRKTTKTTKRKNEISLRPPSRAIEFEFSQDFPNAKYVTWADGKFVEASFLDNDVLSVYIREILRAKFVAGETSAAYWKITQQVQNFKPLTINQLRRSPLDKPYPLSLRHAKNRHSWGWPTRTYVAAGSGQLSCRDFCFRK